jgi:ferric-dicitrate binding protein FerR (iron transport regulator)
MPSMPKSIRLLLTLVLLCVATLGEVAPAGAQAPGIGTVEALLGAATVTRLDASQPRALMVGAELFEGDRIHTEAGARLRLRLQDGSILTCGETTNLTLSRALYAPERDSRLVVLRVPLGIVRAVVGLLVPRSVFEMHTDTAVISARGTEWITEAQPAATATVALEGQVEVRNVDPDVPGAVVLGPGEGVTVEAGVPPPAPTVWGDARRNSFIERTTVP